MLYNCPALAALDIQAQAGRMKFFSDLISTVPVMVLSYPRRYEVLPEVFSAVTEAVEATVT